MVNTAKKFTNSSKASSSDKNLVIIDETRVETVLVKSEQVSDDEDTRINSLHQELIIEDDTSPEEEQDESEENGAYSLDFGRIEARKPDAPLEICTKEEQRSVVRFLGSEGLIPADILKRLKAQYGKKTMSKNQVYVWDKKFKTGLNKVTDMARVGRPKIAEDPATIKNVENMLLENRRATIREIAFNLNSFSHGTVHRVINTFLNLHKFSSRWVPIKLTSETKERRIDVCEELIGRFDYEGLRFLERIVTGDEIWIYWHPVNEENNSHSPPRKKFREENPGNRMLLTLFFDSKGPILEHYSSSSMPYYDLLSDHLTPAIIAKRPNLVTKGVLLLQDHPRPLMMKTTAAMVTDFQIEVLPHPPFSPDLSPIDFYIVGMMKDCLNGRKFDNEKEVQNAIHEWLRDQPIDFYLKGFQALVKRWHSCVEKSGEYFTCVY